MENSKYVNLPAFVWINHWVYWLPVHFGGKGIWLSNCKYLSHVTIIQQCVLLYEEEFRGKLHTWLHCVGDPGIVGENTFALPTAQTDYTAIVWVKVSSLECGSNLQRIERDFSNNNLWRQKDWKHEKCKPHFWSASYVASYWVIIPVLPQKNNTGCCRLKLEWVQLQSRTLLNQISVNSTSLNLKYSKRGVCNRFSVWLMPDCSQHDRFHSANWIFWSSLQAMKATVEC